jgi:DNA-directed RNA polymerase alpha subunit
MSIITPESRIEELRLSAHANDCLKKAGIEFVTDLLHKAGADLRRSCDEEAFNEIGERLACAGLHIGEGLE